MDWNFLLPSATAFGLALLHSSWIGALAYVLVRAGAPLLPSPGARYRLAYAGLLALGAGFLVAFYRNYDASPVCENLLVGSVSLTELTALSPTLSPDKTWLVRLQDFVPGLAPWLSLFYACGLLPATAFLLRDHHRSTRLKTTGVSPLPAAWTAGLAAEFAAHPATRRVRCYLSDRADAVMTLGFWNPVIVFPFALATRLTPAMARTILLHEIGHLRAWDHLLNYPQQLLRTVFFYHPAAHALCRLIDREREHRCDDFVVRRYPNRTTYATALVTVARASLYPQNTLAMSASKTPFSTRIQRLFHGETPRRNTFGFSLLFLAVLGLGHLSFTTLGADAGAVDCLGERSGNTTPSPAPDPVASGTEAPVLQLNTEEIKQMMQHTEDPYFGVLVSQQTSPTPEASPRPELTSRRPTETVISPLPTPNVTIVAPHDTQPPASRPLIIRDVGTPNSGEPLYVIDGVIVANGSLELLDPADIEAISVLKGNSATAVYGEAATNGVVIITTKNGVPATRVLNGDKLAPGNLTDQYGEYFLRERDKVGYLLDGKKVPYATIQALDAKDVLSVRVYEGRKEARKLGFRRMNGVVKVTTRR